MLRNDRLAQNKALFVGIEVAFENARRMYTHVALKSMGLSQGDLVVVRASGEFKVLPVQKVFTPTDATFNVEWELEVVVAQVDLAQWQHVEDQLNG